MQEQLWQWDAADLAQAIRTRAISAREAVSAALDRLAAVNPRIKAVVDVPKSHPRTPDFISSPEFGELFKRVVTNLKPLFGTTQDTFASSGKSRKPRAEVKVAARNPIDLSRLSSASQTDASSSTIAMRASSLLLLGCFIAGIGFLLNQEPIPREVSESIIP